MSMYRFKVGDHVIIGANTSGHGFELGEIVTIDEIFFQGYYAHNTKNKLGWSLNETDIRSMEPRGGEYEMKLGNKVLNNLLDNDTKLLIEMEYLDQTCKITNKGFDTIVAMLFLEKKEELVKLAKEDKADKKKKECK